MKFIVSLSGGLDSTVLLADLKFRFPDAEIHSVSFAYGAKHNKEENWAAALVGKFYATASHRHIDLTRAFVGIESNLMAGGGPIPEGHYQAESMKATVVPGRNTIFAAHLLGLAQSIGASHVFMGIHSGDHAIYPDCRPLWRACMSSAMREASEEAVTLEAPFISLDKVEIVAKGIKLNVPFHLTRTCYTSYSLACGKCGSCVERREAFAKNGVEDPIKYQSAIKPA